MLAMLAMIASVSSAAMVVLSSSPKSSGAPGEKAPAARLLATPVAFHGDLRDLGVAVHRRERCIISRKDVGKRHRSIHAGVANRDITCCSPYSPGLHDNAHPVVGVTDDVAADAQAANRVGEAESSGIVGVPGTQSSRESSFPTPPSSPKNRARAHASMAVISRPPSVCPSPPKARAPLCRARAADQRTPDLQGAHRALHRDIACVHFVDRRSPFLPILRLWTITRDQKDSSILELVADERTRQCSSL